VAAARGFPNRTERALTVELPAVISFSIQPVLDAAKLEHALQDLILDGCLLVVRTCYRRGDHPNGRNDVGYAADDTFLISQNVRHFRELLGREMHPERRSKIIDLLAAELAKLPEPEQRVELIRTAKYLVT